MKGIQYKIVKFLPVKLRKKNRTQIYKYNCIHLKGTPIYYLYAATYCVCSQTTKQAFSQRDHESNLFYNVYIG